MADITDNITDPVITNEEPVVTPVAAPPANPPVEADFSAIVGKDGTFSDNWREQLPEDIRKEACLDSIKNIVTLAKSYVHGQHSIGAKRIAIPGEKATESEINEFYTALGRPESSEKYEFKAPEGVTLDAETEKSFRDAAFKMGLNAKQAQALVEFDLARFKKQQDAAVKARDAEVEATNTALRAEWGDQYAQNLLQYKKTLDTFGLTGILAETGLINNIGLVRALTRVGASVSEAKLPANGTVSSGSVESQINEIVGNPDSPYYKEDDPRHDEAVARLAELLALKK
ncbi:MAG: hypothetical protein MJ016_02135 [Victivallaceae bacterium]|nr:hypothetical protein [Victivallaceae bacterium]